MKFKEIRYLDSDKLRSLCIHQNWYTKGTSEEYEHLMDRSYDSFGISLDMTTEKLAEVARDILDHSDTDYPLTSIMYAIARDCCFTLFEVA